MSVEQRLINTLHRADDFEPSPDLFARVERSIEEDLRHRRRVRWVGMGIVGGVAAAALFLREVVSVSANGLLTAPGWALQLLVTATQVIVVVSLGPTLRRFGKPFIADLFRLQPSTGIQFLNLLDIAFYLFFTGQILQSIHLDRLDRTVALGFSGWLWVQEVAVLLLIMGVAHAVTIAVLPIVGLFFSSSMRRARRHQAGAAAPPVESGAEQSERVVRLIVWGAAALAVIVTLFGVGLFLVGGVFGP
jgi:hypothetical protein